MEHTHKHLGASERISVDGMAEEAPPHLSCFRIQHGTEKKTKEMKKKSLNKEPWFVANGCLFPEIKCERKHVGLFQKVLAHFMTNHAKGGLGANIAYIPFKKRKR